MSITDEVIDRFAKALPTLLDILKNGFKIDSAVLIGAVKLLEVDDARQEAEKNEEESLGDLFYVGPDKRLVARWRRISEALSSIVGRGVTAPVMSYYTPNTMFFTKGYILSASVTHDWTSLTIAVRLSEPVPWRDVASTITTYVLNLDRRWGLLWDISHAVGFVTFMALNKHVEDAVLNALQLMGFKTDRLREAVRRTRMVYEEMFGDA